MSGHNNRAAFGQRAGMPAFGNFSSQQPSASMLFEKQNPGIRRSTPDSEALASSDDEGDPNRTIAQPPKMQKPARRTSWLNDVPTANATLNRKTSGNMPYSPTASNPGTPASEQPTWLSMTNTSAAGWTGGPNSSTAAWPSIWSNQDARKEPSRLHEVMSNSQEAGLPFSIPLQPTPKTFRSQSYSVGQLESAMGAVTTSPVEQNRYRQSGHMPSLQRRTSRTAGLGVVNATGLDRLHEEDGEEYQNVNPDQYQASRIEKLERENAQLRAAHAGSRTFSTSALTTGPSSSFRPFRTQGSLPEEYDDAVDDQESMSGSGLLQRRDNASRRMSEQALAPYERQAGIEARGFDDARNAKWQTHLGFGGIPEQPQSRRHSMADVPARHASMGSQGSFVLVARTHKLTETQNKNNKLSTISSCRRIPTRQTNVSRPSMLSSSGVL